MAPVFQIAREGLSPVLRVGAQILDSLAVGGGGRADLMPLLGRLGLGAEVAALYPHELSGGMAQRVAVARAIATGAALVLADEPTSALDGPSARAVLSALSVAAGQGRAVLLVTHDAALVAGMAHRMAVLIDGRLVESGPTLRVLDQPSHPRVISMMAALPARAASLVDLGGQAGFAPEPGPGLLEVEGLGFGYRGSMALQEVALSLGPGRVLAICGASGSGKSSLARLITRLDGPPQGRILWRGRDVAGLSPRAFARDGCRREIQLVQQEAGASFIPRETVRAGIVRALGRFGIAPGGLDALAIEAGLEPALLDRRPSTLSQGQLARAALVRAVALRPDLLVLDEPTAALDASRQAGVLLLLDRLRRRGTAVLIVTHDLHVARLLADEVMVMAAGRVVEQAATATLLANPRHAATQALVAAMPGRVIDGTGGGA